MLRAYIWRRLVTTRNRRAAVIGGAISVILAVAVLGPTHRAQACSCTILPAADVRRASVFVFEGVLTRFIPASGERPRQAVFRLYRVWRGAAGQTLSVQVEAPDSMCPPHFAVGQRYIVYATGSEAAPRVRQCARYAAAEGLAAERRALGRPLRTFPAMADFPNR